MVRCFSFAAVLCAVTAALSVGAASAMSVGSNAAAPSPSSATPSGVSECLVIGCGVLGTSLCRQILQLPTLSSCKVTAVTKTTNRHQAIRDAVLGNEAPANELFDVKTMEECRGTKYDNVIFCAPPSGFDDYAEAVKDAVQNMWSSAGVFIFTSSGSVYGPGEDGAVVNEHSPLADPDANPRSGRLIRAEEAVRSHGGCCLRLAGLYNLDRGAHNFWITSGKPVSGRRDGIINQLHYDDAAGAALAALLAGPAVVSGNAYLVSDGNPMTREEICASALKAKKYAGMSMPEFMGKDTDPKGKIYDGAATNRALKWDPTYVSFDAFMSAQA